MSVKFTCVKCRAVVEAESTDDLSKESGGCLHIWRFPAEALFGNSTVPMMTVNMADLPPAIQDKIRHVVDPAGQIRMDAVYDDGKRLFRFLQKEAIIGMLAVGGPRYHPHLWIC